VNRSRRLFHQGMSVEVGVAGVDQYGVVGAGFEGDGDAVVVDVDGAVASASLKSPWSRPGWAR
jgi:hypothetical protein